MKKIKMNRLLALLLSLSVLTAAVGALEVRSNEPQQEASVAETLSNFLLNKIQEAPTDIAAIKDRPSDIGTHPQRTPA